MTGQLTLDAATLELPAVDRPIPAVDELLAELATSSLQGICNFYAGAGVSAAERRERLRRYLHARWAAPIVLVGEAAGWRGACRSGIAFTSEHQLLGHGYKEASATIVHRVLGELGADGQVLLWNALPFHPFPPDRHDANRTPTAAEVAAGRPFLEAVTAGRQVVAVGRIAARVLAPTDLLAVRHPSHGGATAFQAGLTAALAAGTGAVP